MRTLYEVLEVSEEASKEVIEKAYKVLVKKYHPDLQQNENKENADEMIKKINDAYDVLSDNTKRVNYDAELKQQRINEKQEYEKNLENDIYNNIINSTQNINQEAQQNVNSGNNINEVRYYTRPDINISKTKYYNKRKSKWEKIKAMAIFIIIFAGVFTVGWFIPYSHDWMIDLYKNNIIIKMLVNIVIGIGKGFYETIKQMTNRI